MNIDFTGVYTNRGKFNIVDDYVMYHHTRAYMRQKHKEFFGSRKNTDQNMEKTLKFFADYGLIPFKYPSRLLEDWKDLKGIIPWFYFDTIDVDPGVLSFVLEADAEEYVNVLRQPIIIDKFIVRYMAGVYASKTMPPSTEIGAIDYIRDFQKNNPFRCCINIRDVKSIFVELDDTVKHTYYYPEFKKTKTCFTFSGSNRNNGVSRVAPSGLKQL